MKSDNKRIRNLCFSVVCIHIVVLGAGAGARANPTITVTWDCAGTPVDPDDYHVDYSTPAFPDVELKAECDTWKIKSVDGENPGDIGEITATGAYNYGLTITDGSGGAGAREVKKIDLNPSDEAKYSLLNGGQISGNLTGDLFVQESSGESGGSVSLTVDGNVEGDITAATIASLSIGGNLSGSVIADDVTGSLSIGGDASGNIELWELSGSLTITGDVHAWLMVTYGSSGTITTGRWTEHTGEIHAEMRGFTLALRSSRW